MHLWSLVGTSFGRSTFFVLLFPVWTFSGLVGKAYSPPIFTLYVYHGWHLTKSVVVYFLQDEFPITWPFIKIMRTPLYIEGYPLIFNGSDVFGRGSKRVLWNFRALSARPDCETPLWYSYIFSLLFPGSWLSDRFPGGFSWDHRVPVVPFWKGLQSFWRYCFARERDFLGSIVPAFLCCLSATKNFSSGSLPSSLTGLLW